MMPCKTEIKIIHQIPILLMVVVSFLLQGCAINHTGLVTVRQFENATIRMVSKEAWGIYLSTGSSDAGLTIGHVKRNLIYAKDQAESKLSVTEILSRLQQDKLVESSVDETGDSRDSQPIAWTADDQGLMIHTNSYETGLVLGIEIRDVMRLPSDFSGFFVIKKNSQGNIKAYFQNSAAQDENEQ